jgi:hypothetical protein
MHAKRWISQRLCASMGPNMSYYEDDDYDRRKRPGGSGLLSTLATVAFFSVLLLGVGWFAVGEPSVERDEFGCPKSADAPAPRHVVFLVDRSDPLDLQQLADVKAEIRGILDILKKNERLTVYAVNPDSGSRPQELFYLCRPDNTPKTRLELAIEEVIGSRKKRAEEFLSAREDLEKSLTKLTVGRSLSTTSLMKDIAAIASYRSFSRYANTDLIIYSDMIENSSILSQYKATMTFGDFSKALSSRYRVPKLKDVTVRILYRLDDKYVNVQTQAHQTFWRDFFDSAEAGTVMFEPEL